MTNKLQKHWLKCTDHNMQPIASNLKHTGHPMKQTASTFLYLTNKRFGPARP
jgi:hypothetical protein